MEDILDLQQCLGGVQRCLDSGDLLGAASTIKRFKAVEKLLPVSDRDRRLMQRAEAALLQVRTPLPVLFTLWCSCDRCCCVHTDRGYKLRLGGVGWGFQRGDPVLPADERAWKLAAGAGAVWEVRQPAAHAVR